MVVGQDHYAEAEPDALGLPGEGAQYHLWARRSGKAGEEVVLDEPDPVEARLVGRHALLDGLVHYPVVVQCRTLHLVN